MRILAHLAAVAVLSTAMVSSTGHQPAALAETEPDRLAAYEWRPLSTTDPQALAAALESLAGVGGTEVLLDISEVADLTESGDSKGLSAYRARLDGYLSHAAAHGIRVSALAGSPHWISPGARYVTDILLDFVVDYNAAAPGPSLASLHFDLEPWATPQWSKRKRALTLDLLSTVDHVASAARSVPAGQRFPVAFAMPFWLDGTAAPRGIRYGGERMSPTAHVMELLDSSSGRRNEVAIMAYRDRVDGRNGSIALLSEEFELAARHEGRVGVIIAQEISPVDPPSITFHEEGWPALSAAMDELSGTYGEEAAFAGFAVNDLRSVASQP